MISRNTEKLKELYAKAVREKDEKASAYLNRRLFTTYNRIVKKIAGKELSGINIDLGSGDSEFSDYCKSIGIFSFAYDYPNFDLEKDTLPHDEKTIDFITMNAVIEHLSDPSNALSESYRVLKPKGFIFIRTPNWKMDFRNFYDDPTHIRPYTPKSLKKMVELFGFEVVFLEPGLVEKSWFWWRFPNFAKWRVARMLIGGTKSILCVGQK